MKREIRLSEVAKARLWERELPRARYRGQTLRRVVGEGSVARPDFCAALEVFVPRGGMAQYALLGGDFRADNRGCLALSVVTNDELGGVFPSLAREVDEVRVGLPKAFASEVLNAVMPKGPLPSGIVHISCAAHGLIGSSADLFGRVASLLMTRLCEDQLSIVEMRAQLLGVAESP